MRESQNTFRDELQQIGGLDDYAERPSKPLDALELLDRLHGAPLNNADWVFRGQSHPWPLRPTIERIADPAVMKRLGTVERPLIREFMSRVHHYTADMPDEGDELGWLALMPEAAGLGGIYRRRCYVLKAARAPKNTTCRFLLSTKYCGSIPL